ncbi:MAG: hypothetical protein AABW71_00355 [Nanoarchaeota archaeon]
MDDNSRRRQEDWERSLAAWKSKQNKESSVPHHQPKPVSTPSQDQYSSKAFNKFLIFLAFAIPLALLGYALYINYLPFGYEKSYELTVDENGVISPLSNEIYLTTPQGRKLLSLPEGVQGQVNLVIDPKVVLKNSTINVSIEGDNVYLAPLLSLDLDSMEWDHNWDFSQNIPEEFEGTAEYNEEEACTHFNAYNEQTLNLPNSEDMFESGPMSIYVKWKPSYVSQKLGNNQQLAGHFNWEIWQNEKSVQFRVGRMNDANGSMHSISYPIDLEFFGKEHEALAVYSPSEDGNGYIELWIDKNLAGRALIGSDVIYPDYNFNISLNFGWSSHNNGNNPYYDGCLYEVKVTDIALKEERNQFEINGINGKMVIPVIGNGNLKVLKAIISQ